MALTWKTCRLPTMAFFRFIPIQNLPGHKLNLKEKPLEINRAERQDLIRVPGIGPKAAEAIMRTRRISKLKDLSSLQKMGIMLQRAAPYILINGRKAAQQLSLF